MSLGCLIGRSKWAQSLRQSVRQAAQFSSNVLITGPSGTGKELIARSIHDESSRSSGPFVPVDCTALTGELFAGSLFGHVKGAFTGADHARLGCFRAADGGTILLDEIGELSGDSQSKLLRTIQERAVVPLGSDGGVSVNVRLVAATNRDLAHEVQAGRFRLDLFYRLNVIHLQTTALCERIEDIEPLATHFLHKMAVDHGFSLKRLSRGGLAALEMQSWPGNVRQLQNTLERAIVFTAGDTIDDDSIASSLDVDPKVVPSQRPVAEPATPSVPPQTAWRSLAEVEREHIQATLANTYFNQKAAASLLAIHRTSLARKIAFYRIPIPNPRATRRAIERSCHDRAEY